MTFRDIPLLVGAEALNTTCNFVDGFSGLNYMIWKIDKNVSYNAFHVIKIFLFIHDI